MITRYVRPPGPFEVHYVTEPGDYPPAVLYASRQRARRWAEEGHGELVVWNTTPVRLDDGERRIFLLNDPPPDAEAGDGLDAWASFMRSAGARCASLRSTSRSLLRASLTSDVIPLGAGTPPPIKIICGGREELATTRGSHLGPVVHWDQQASYAHRLGRTMFGGWWTEVDPTELHGIPSDLPAFVHARVRVPDYTYRDERWGPLVRRPRSKRERQRRAWFRQARKVLPSDDWGPDEYPTGATMQGIWTWAEIESARAHGCTVKADAAWRMVAASDERPFERWWAMIQEARELPGYAGDLAKATGNVLWSSFALSDGDLVAYSWNRRTMRQRKLPWRPRYSQDNGLAEHVTGTGRALLHEAMHSAGDFLVVSHTDGLWVANGEWKPPSADWRRKDVASAVDVIGPGHLCYTRPGSDRPLYVMAGSPSEDAPADFEEMWRAWRLKRPLAHRRDAA